MPLPDRGFGEALREARKASQRYEKLEFCRVTELNPGTLSAYENGNRIPQKKELDRILRLSTFDQETIGKIRKAWVKAQLARVGINISEIPLPNTAGISDRIATEIRFELKRMGINMTPRTQAVCRRRIELILSSALEDR